MNAKCKDRRASFQFHQGREQKKSVPPKEFTI